MTKLERYQYQTAEERIRQKDLWDLLEEGEGLNWRILSDRFLNVDVTNDRELLVISKPSVPTYRG